MHGTIGLRDTYKTAGELKCSQGALDALAWFVDQVDSGFIKDLPFIAVDVSSNVNFSFREVSPAFFYMPHVFTVTDCGTAGCIKGWIQHRLDGNDYQNDAMYDLFFRFPNGVGITEARDATVRVLRGEPAWLEWD